MSSDSTTNNSYSTKDDDEYDSDESWDDEQIDEEIFEIREVLERSKLTVSNLEESSDSLDNEDNELIKAKLRALRDYVSDLQASYNELLQTFKQLEDAAKQKVSIMEGKLSAALKCAKDFQERCNALESQIKLLNYNRHNNSDIPHYHSEAQSQINALEDDLSSVLKAISQGVESGVIKLSGLQLSTQENPLPLQDVIISPRVNNIELLSSTVIEPSDNRPHPHNKSITSHVTDSDHHDNHNTYSNDITQNERTSIGRTESHVHSTNTDTHSTRTDVHSTTPETRVQSTNNVIESNSCSMTDNHVTTSVSHVTNTPLCSNNDTDTQDTPIITSSLLGTHPNNDHSRRELVFQQIEQLSKETQTSSLPETNTQFINTSDSLNMILSDHSVLVEEHGSIPKTDQFNDNAIGMDLLDKENESNEDVYQLQNEEDILAQMLEKDCHIAELETCIQDLNHQLQESHHLNESTQLTLQDTRELLHKQRINGVVSTEGELADVMAKISRYESEREGLQSLVDIERNKVLTLEQQREETINEMEHMKQQIDTLTRLLPTEESHCNHGDDDTKLLLKARLAINNDSLQNVTTETSELQSQRDSLYQQCSEAEDKVLLLQSSLKAARQEANKLQSITARKESELTRVVSAIHTTRAKLASIHQTTRIPSPTNTDNETIGDDDIIGIEWDVNTIKQKWEELCLDLSKHEAAIASLTGRELTLQSELDRRAARVIELESLLQAKELGAGFNKKSLSGVLTTVDLLKNELSDTKRNYTFANQQMIDTCQQLQSNVHSLVDQLQLLQAQVLSKDQKINNLQMEQKQLLELYQLNNNKITEDETERIKKEESLQRLSMELLSSQQRIEELEESLDNSHEQRLRDIEYQKAVITDMINELQQINNEGGVVIDETMEPTSLKSKINQRDKLLQTLQEQTCLLIEQHSNLIQQTDHTQDIVSDLETKLLSTQTLCDALEQEVADGHRRLAQVQQQLIESEKERLQLSEQLETLRNEAEDTCNSLEKALNRTGMVEQESQDRIASMREQLYSQQIQQQNNIMELNGLIDEKDNELLSLQSDIEGLKVDNRRLHADNTQHKTLVAKLKEELEFSSSSSLESEVRLATLETLRLQLDDAESARIVSNNIAQERLNDIRTLQERNEELLLVNKQIKLKLSGDSITNRDYKSKVEMLHEEIETVKALYDAKSSELDKMKYSYQLAMKKEETIIEQLDECRRELAICKKRADELDIRYQSTLSDLSVSQTELDSLKTLYSSEQKVCNGNGQVFKLKTRITLLTKQLEEGRNDFEKLQASLKAMNEEKRNLLHKLGTLEEHYHSLIRSNSQQKLILNRNKIQNEKQRKVCLSLKNDYDNLTDQMCDWATNTKTTTEALVQKIREQDHEILSLKEQQHDLMRDNEQLRGTMGDPSSTSDGGSCQPLIGLPQLHNQYQELLEKGLSSTSALDTSGYSSPSESTDELDKSYWIKRAGELSLQLQQSSQYWSAKVREQSLKIQKYETS